MSGKAPVVYLLHGDDPVGMQKFIRTLIEKMGDPGTAEMNIARLDAAVCSEDDLLNGLMAIPFLADRRLVILSNPLAKFQGKKSRKKISEDAAVKTPGDRFINLLDCIPETTGLVLPVEDWQEWARGSSGGGYRWKNLPPEHDLSRWAAEHAEGCLVREFLLPRPAEMAGWVMKEAAAQGGEFAPDAAALLAEYIGTDTQIAALEVNKLVTYAGGRKVAMADVEMLSVNSSQANIFDMVDAISGRSAQRALHLYHQLLVDQDPRELFGMIIRQFRLLLQVREILDTSGSSQTVINELHLPQRVAAKLFEQARRFSMAQLKGFYRRLLEIEVDSKSSQGDLSVAFDEFIVDVANLSS
jgi:DNA polymerase-3 subunit delta